MPHPHLTLVASSLLCGLFPGQGTKTPTAQPADLVFGTVREGTRIEGNFLVFWNDARFADEATEVEATGPVRVLASENDMRAGTGPTTRVWLSIETGEIGAVESSVTVKCEGHTLTVPVEAVVLPRDPLSTRVLVAGSPFDGYSSDDSSVFDGWRGIVDRGKLEVHYVNAKSGSPIVPVDVLQRVDVVLVDPDGLMQCTPDDMNRLQGFISGGGRVILTADRFFRGTVAKANELATGFGLRMEDAEVAQVVELADEQILDHPMTEGVEVVKVRRPSPTALIEPERAKALVQMPGNPDRAFIALSRTESRGELVTIGESLWWAWVHDYPESSRLLRNLLTRERR